MADEVRSLAGRSAKAAKETAEMIENSVTKTEKGTEIADITAEGFSHILNSVSKTAQLVNDIDSASNEQAEGINQVNIGLSNIDQVIQEVSANSEEEAAASEKLANQAARLQDILINFQQNEKTNNNNRTDDFSGQEKHRIISYANDYSITV